MKLKVFTVYDSAVGAYMQPFLMQSKGAAIRAWQDTITNAETQFSKHPADFTLFEIATYDEDSGRFENLTAPINLGTALEHGAKISEAPKLPLGVSNLNQNSESERTMQ